MATPSVGVSAAAGYSTADAATTSSRTTQSTTAIVVFANWQDSNSPLPAITDSKGNTYTLLQSLPPSGGTFSNYLAAWVCLNATGGSGHTVTCTKTNGYPSVWMVEVVNATATASTGATASGSPFSSGNLTVGGDRLLLGFSAYEGTGTTAATVSSGFTTLDEISDFSFWQGVSASRTVASGTYGFTATVTNVADGGAVLVALEGSASSGITGTLSATLGTATLAGTGTVRVSGTTAAALAPATIAATGTVRVSGTLSATLGAATASGAGGLTVIGTLNQTLGAATLSSTGTVRIAGAMSATLGPATLAATGTVADPGTITGSLSATLEPATLAATATLTGGDPVDPGRQGGGGGTSLVSPKTSRETRRAVLAAYEAAEQAAQAREVEAPAEPEAPKPAPRKTEKPAKRRDVAIDLAADQTVVVANTAMADALAKVGDGLSDLVAARQRDEADELAALLLILAEV